jgi:broad specificity phosphatase PhoE
VATVHIVRHANHGQLGRILVGRGNVGLAEDGRGQAAKLAAYFSARRIDTIKSSPRRRTRETAKAIADAALLPCEISPALDEIDFGEWTGLPFDALDHDPRWQAWNTARGQSRAPGGEAMHEAQSRILAEIERARREVHEGAVVLVTHAEIIRAAILHYLNLPLDQWSRIEISPASVSTLVFDGSGAPSIAVNERIAG